MHWLQKHESKLVRLEQEMKQHAVKILLAAKLTFSMGIPVLVAAGMARVRWRRWFPVVFAAECIKTGSLVFIGFHLGEYIKLLENWMQMMAIMGIIIFIGAIIWSIRRISKTSQLDAV
jgi:membrane protein DedA with SNARE-associated domain